MFGKKMGIFSRRVDKSAPVQLRGVIVSYANGIQAVKTDSKEEGKQFLHFMGRSLIQCPICATKAAKLPGQMQWCSPCEHVKCGTVVVATYVVSKDGFGLPTGAEWRGKAVV